MKLGNQTALTPLQTALTTETEAIVLPVIKLAIVQLQKASITEDDWN
jgi:hypothetical protein